MHVELWLVSERFSAFGRTEDLLAGQGAAAFPLAALTCAPLCCSSWAQHRSLYMPTSWLCNLDASKETVRKQKPSVKAECESP